MTATELEVIKDYTGRDYRTVWTRGPRAAFEDKFEGTLISELAPTESGWFLDLGAAYGRLLPLYERPGRRVVFVDYAVNLLQIAAERWGERDDVSYVAANAYHLPFRRGSFAAGLSVRVFHHMAHPELFLSETSRVLTGGARFLLEYSNKRNVLRVLRHGRRSLRRDHEDYGDLLFGTHPDHFRELSAAAGLSVVRTRGTGFFSRLLTDRTAVLSRPLAGAEEVTDALLERAELTPIVFADLRKEGVPTEPVPASLADMLECPACEGEVGDAGGGMQCTACDRVYPREGAVLDFRYVGRL